MRSFFAFVLYPAALLVEVLRHRESPWKFRAQVVAALAYLIFPWDFIPDLLPFVGLSDDLVALVIVFVSLGRNLPGPVKDAARKRARLWARLSS
jgi:uncharacterized membrane protein YkvA (DUF1232 family)